LSTRSAYRLRLSWFAGVQDQSKNDVMPPKRFWSTAWNAGPPSWLQPKQKQQYSTWDQNRTQQFKAKAKRAYVVCGSPSCTGWLYVGNGETSCRTCGCDIDLIGGNEAGSPTAWGAADKIDGAAFDALGADDPIRHSLQQLVDSGKATLDRKVAGDPFVGLQVKVGRCLREMVKAQGVLNHHRNTLRQCRDRISKLEESVSESEKECKQKIDESNEANAMFEKMVSERNLKSNWAAAMEQQAAAGTAPAKVIERNAQLEAELLAMQRAMQQMSLQLQALQGHGSAAAGAAPAAPAAAASGAGGAAPIAPAATPLAGQLALVQGDGGEPPGQGSKRFRAGFEAAAAAAATAEHVDADMGDGAPKGSDPVEDFADTQEAATKLLADAQAAAASAASNLEQRG
jgi:hypothetical protein